MIPAFVTAFCRRTNSPAVRPLPFTEGQRHCSAGPRCCRAAPSSKMSADETHIFRLQPNTLPAPNYHVMVVPPVAGGGCVRRKPAFFDGFLLLTCSDITGRLPKTHVYKFAFIRHRMCLKERDCDEQKTPAGTVQGRSLRRRWI
jgi:hypothetical protein